jgi:hypothetical protein
VRGDLLAREQERAPGPAEVDIRTGAHDRLGRALLVVSV